MLPRVGAIDTSEHQLFRGDSVTVDLLETTSEVDQEEEDFCPSGISYFDASKRRLLVLLCPWWHAGCEWMCARRLHLWFPLRSCDGVGVIGWGQAIHPQLHVIPSALSLVGASTVFQQDSDPGRETSIWPRDASDWALYHTIRPPRSLDLKPISILGMSWSRKKNPRSSQYLQEVFKTAAYTFQWASS